MSTQRIEDTANTLEWLAGILREANRGDEEACALMVCFTREWCGMIAVGPTLIASDIADILEIGRHKIDADRENDRLEAERVCMPERG